MKGREEGSEEPLQAVVLADSYDRRFMPLTCDGPRCLMPLANIPLIDYTLEFLARAKVQQVIVFVNAHADAIKDHLRSSSRCNKFSGMTIQAITSLDSHSMGDAMRELDGQGILHGDFILVCGDVVSNIDMEPILEEHRRRRARDKNAIMTMVLKEAGAVHPTRSRADAAVFVLNSETSECLHYEAVPALPKKKRIAIDLEVLSKHSNWVIRNDLIDPQIDICSVDCPALFTENFDYQDIRSDFVHGVLTSDLLGKTIYASLVREGYAARVRGTAAYDTISKDVLSRWTAPLVPDVMLDLQEGLGYNYRRHHRYLGEKVDLARSCMIGERVMVGSGSRIGESVMIQNAVIGKGCSIGKRSRLVNCYLWHDVEIGDDVFLNGCILGDHVRISHGASVPLGCMLGRGVVIGSDVHLNRDTKISMVQPRDWARGQDAEQDETETSEAGFEMDEDKEVSARYDVEIVGASGRGYLWTHRDGHSLEDEDDDEELDASLNPANEATAVLGHDSRSIDRSDSSSTVSGITESSLGESDPDLLQSLEAADDLDFQSFEAEVRTSLERAFDEDHSIEVAALELNMLGKANNRTFEDLRKTALPVILARMVSPKSVEQIVKRWAGLLLRLVSTASDQIDALNVIQDYYAESDQPKLFLPTLKSMYEYDVIEEAALEKWYTSPCSQGKGVSHDQLRTQAHALISFLAQADEEESESEED